MSEPQAPVAPSSAAVVRQLESLWEQGQRPDPDALLKAAGVSSPLEIATVLAADQWHRWNAGERVWVEDYFARHPVVAAVPDAALKLAFGEFVVPEEQGDAPSRGDYLARFPQCAEPLGKQIDFHKAVEEATPTVVEPEPPHRTAAAPPAAGGMDATPVSLLMRIRQSGQQEAWARFVELCTPVLLEWARRLGLRDTNAADLLQEVFLLLVRVLPRFRYDHHKSFRGWLYTVTVNKWREMQRRSGTRLVPAGADGLAGLAADPTDSWDDAEYRRHLVGRAVQFMKREFQPSTWKACWEVVVDGRKPADVAANLGITLGAVYAAKARVLRRLRQELAGLLD